MAQVHRQILYRPRGRLGFGDDVDSLVGIPALAIAGTDIGIRRDHFLLRYRDLGVEHKYLSEGRTLTHPQHRRRYKGGDERRHTTEVCSR